MNSIIYSHNNIYSKIIFTYQYFNSLLTVAKRIEYETINTLSLR